MNDGKIGGQACLGCGGDQPILYIPGVVEPAIGEKVAVIIVSEGFRGFCDEYIPCLTADDVRGIRSLIANGFNNDLRVDGVEQVVNC